jgi:hypothetical protein
MESKQEAVDYQHIEQQPGTMPPLGDEPIQGEGSSARKEKANAGSLEDGPAEHLIPEHREYLLSRHKTVDLDPLPAIDPADPLNWPSWKVLVAPNRAPSHADSDRKILTCSSLPSTH